MNNDIVPDFNGPRWRLDQGPQFIDLIRQLGEPIYEYDAPFLNQETL